MKIIFLQRTCLIHGLFAVGIFALFVGIPFAAHTKIVPKAHAFGTMEEQIQNTKESLQKNGLLRDQINESMNIDVRLLSKKIAKKLDTIIATPINISNKIVNSYVGGINSYVNFIHDWNLQTADVIVQSKNGFENGLAFISEKGTDLTNNVIAVSNSASENISSNISANVWSGVDGIIDTKNMAKVEFQYSINSLSLYTYCKISNCEKDKQEKKYANEEKEILQDKKNVEKPVKETIVKNKKLQKEVQTIIKERIVERIIEKSSPVVINTTGITEEEFTKKLQELNNELRQEIFKVRGSDNVSNSIQTVYRTIALSNKIDKLNGVTITNSTITGSFSGITDAHIPDSITASNYLLLTGGELTGTTSATAFGVGTTSPSDTFALNGAMYFAPISAPAQTTDRLYNVSNNLYWAGNLIGGASTANWTVSGSDAYRATGNIGIGTTSPYAKLSVDGDGVFTGVINVQSTTQASTFPYASTTALTVSGNSYLGTVASGIWNGTSIGDSYIDDTITASNYLTLSDWYGTSTSDIAEGTNLYWTNARFAGQLAGTTTDALSEGGTNLYYTNARVNSLISASSTILNTNTESGFESFISGVSNFFTNNDTITSSNIADTYLFNNADDVTTGSLTATEFIANDTTATSTFAGGFSAGTTGLVYDYSSGNVGIGTASPGAVLDIVSTSVDNLRLNGGGTANTIIRFHDEGVETAAIYTLDGASDLRLRGIGEVWLDGGGGTNGDLVVNSTGNVGIGTVSPSVKLTTRVGQDEAGLVIGLASDSISYTENRRRVRLGTENWNGAMWLYSSSDVEKVHIDANDISYFNGGNVGIGTTSPAYKLDVAGTFNASAAATFGGTLTVSAQCVTADTRLRRRRRRKKEETDEELEELFRARKILGYDDEYVYDEIMIKHVRAGDEIASMDPKTGNFVWSIVNGLMDMGIQDVYEIITQTGRSIKTTNNHPYFRRGRYDDDDKLQDTEPKAQKLYKFEVDQSIKIEQYTKDTIVAIANEENSIAVIVPKEIKQSLRTFGQKNNSSRHTKMVLFATAIVTALRKMTADVHELSIDTEYTGHDDIIAQIIKNSFPNININFTQVGKKSPAHYACYGVHTKQKTADYTAVMDDIRHIAENALGMLAHQHIRLTIRHTTRALLNNLSVSEEQKDVKQKSISLDTRAGIWTVASELKAKQMIAVVHGNSIVWEKIKKIKKLPEEKVYDIEVEGTRNFIGNDIVAHNTYLNGGTTLGDASGDALTINSSAVSVPNNLNFDANTFVIDSANNRVGIGTDSPGANLDILSSSNAVQILLSDIATDSAPKDGWVAVKGYSISEEPLGVIKGRANSAATSFIDIGGDSVISGIVNAATEIRFLTASTATTLNGTQRMVIDSAGNVGIGLTNPSYKLDVTGFINTDGTVGGYKIDGNTILQASSTNFSTLVGQFAGESLFADSLYNTAIGHNALATATSSNANTAVGYVSLYSNTTGTQNSVQGVGALYSNTTGSYNSALGRFAGRYIADGTTGNTAGNSNTFLGYNTKALADNQQNQIVIGHNAIGVGSNSVVLGNDSIATTVLKGNVGIGTASPQAKLEVSSTGTSLLDIVSDNDANSSDNDAVLRFYIDGSAGTGTKKGDVRYNQGRDIFTLGYNQSDMVFDSSGNVGIGTTSPYAKLSVENTGSGDSFIINDETSDATPFVVDASGNVGIGTASPAKLLEVSHTSNTAGLRVTRNDAVGNTGIELANTDGVKWAMQVWGGTDFSISNSMNGTSRLFIDRTSGSVGIGTTIPGSLHANARNLVVGSGSGNKGLTIFSGSNFDGNIYFADGVNTTEAYRGVIEYEHANDAMAFRTGANERLRIDSSGDVGIGTASPTSKLHIADASALLTIEEVGTSNRTTTAGYSDGYNFKINNSSGAIHFQIGGVDKLILNSGGLYNVFQSGNVGIGTTTPSTFKLQIAGDVGPDADNSYNLGAAGSDWGCLYYDSGTLGTCASDERLKEDISILTFGDDPLAKVAGLQLRTFNFISDESNSKYKGLIAQDVMEIAPELIATSADGFLAVKYGDLQWLVISAVKQIYVEITDLASVVAGNVASILSNKNEITALEARIIALEAQIAGGGGVGGASGASAGIVATAPTLTIQGNNPAQITLNTNYSDMGAIAVATTTDGTIINPTIHLYLDGTAVNSIQIDTSTSTTYLVEYVAEFEGLTATSSRNVIVGTNEAGLQGDGSGADDGGSPTSVSSDTTAPVISLVGSTTISVIEGDTYTDEGATANDETDGNITAQIITDGTVDTATIGTYTLTYNVSDQAGNPATEATRVVTVIPVPTPPIVVSDPATDTSTSTDPT